MNTTPPRPISQLTGETSRKWHSNAPTPLSPEVGGTNDGNDGKTALPFQKIKGNGRRILLVDDEPVLREVTRILLEQSGFEVVTAKDGVTGLLAFAAHPNYALVISDLRMPRADGRKLITSIRAQAPTLPIICMTGVLSGALDTEEFKRQMGINTVLEKPFTHATLIASLERELAVAS